MTRLEALERVAEAARMLVPAQWRYVPSLSERFKEAEHALAALDALPPSASGWQKIETYPREHDPGPDTYWGPEATLLVPACKHYHHGPTLYVGHLEADEWLVRDSNDPGSWGELHCAPTFWLPARPLPSLPEDTK